LDLVIFIFTFFFIYNFINHDSRKNSLNNDALEKQAEATASSTVYLTNKIYSEAFSRGSAEICKDINDANQSDLCIKLVAIKMADIDKCDMIGLEKIKNECNEEVNRVLFQKTLNIDYCKKIKNSTGREQCFLNFINKKNFDENGCRNLDEEAVNLCLDLYYYEESQEKIDIKFCQKMHEAESVSECINDLYYINKDIEICRQLTGDTQTLCYDIIGYNLATDKKDIKYCDYIISDNKEKECQEKINNLSDKDFDGLSNESEKTYGTDPEKKDTDGDGHPDGEEVRNGFNPSGEGKLNANNK
jgi:hypothetical protein